VVRGSIASLKEKYILSGGLLESALRAEQSVSQGLKGKLRNAEGTVYMCLIIDTILLHIHTNDAYYTHNTVLLRCD
jgi:hypothetical protein